MLFKPLVLCFLIFAPNAGKGQFFFGSRPKEEDDSARTSFEDRAKPCFVPTGKSSFCVPLKQCPYVSDMVKGLNKPLANDVALLIRDSFFCPKDDPTDDITICCPLEGIDPPLEENPVLPDKNQCLTQTGAEATCTFYNKCSPFLQLIKNLKKPIPKTLPKLMQGSWLCGFGEVGGFSVPQICCPNDAIIKDDPEQTETSTTSTTTTTSATTTTTSLEKERFALHDNRNILAGFQTCGRQTVDAKIVNGEETEIGEFPWLANLGYSIAGRNFVDFKCGGALIGDRYVITAAHCVTQLPGSYQLVRVRLGEHRLSTDPDCADAIQGLEPFCNETPQDFDVEEIIFHEDYGVPQVFRNDIALIRLSRPAKMTDFVQPICLPFDHDETESYKNTTSDQGLYVAVAGWGATNERGRDPADALQKLEVPIFDAEKCKEVYETRGGILDPQAQMCAGAEPGKDSCVGDSGSALMREEKPKVGKTYQYSLLGVVSFGPRLCGTKGVPGVYTRVRHYLDWILDHVRE